MFMHDYCVNCSPVFVCTGLVIQPFGDRLLASRVNFCQCAFSWYCFCAELSWWWSTWLVTSDVRLLSTILCPNLSWWSSLEQLTVKINILGIICCTHVWLETFCVVILVLTIYKTVCTLPLYDWLRYSSSVCKSTAYYCLLYLHICCIYLLLFCFQKIYIFHLFPSLANTEHSSTKYTRLWYCSVLIININWISNWKWFPFIAFRMKIGNYVENKNWTKIGNILRELN